MANCCRSIPWSSSKRPAMFASNLPQPLIPDYCPDALPQPTPPICRGSGDLAVNSLQYTDTGEVNDYVEAGLLTQTLQVPNKFYSVVLNLLPGILAKIVKKRQTFRQSLFQLYVFCHLTCQQFVKLQEIVPINTTLALF